MSIHKIRNYLTIFALFFCCNLAFAQLNIQGKQYTVKDGLPDNWVNAAMLDKDGYMWFGTAYGLSRFDGENFINYYENPEDPFALSSLFIRDILQHKDGTIWLATLGGGLNCLDPSKATFKDYPIDTLLYGADAEPLLITDIEIIGDMLWYACYNDGFGVFDLNSRKFCAKYNLPKDPQFKDNVFDGNSVWHITASGKQQGVLWLAAKNRGLIRFEIATGKQTVYPILDFFGNAGVLCAFDVLEDKEGIIWIASYGKGLIRFDPATEEMEHYLYADFEDKHRAQVTNWVLSVLEKSDTELWVATGDHGFGVFNKVTGTYRFFESESIGENPALHTEVEKIYLDRNDRLWVLGKKDGIYKFDLNRQFIKYYSLPSELCDFEAQYVSSFSFSDQRQFIYLATRSCGVFKHNIQTKETTKLVLESEKLPNLLSVLVDSKGGIWAGSGKSGSGHSSLFYAKNDRTPLRVHSLPEALFYDMTINVLFEDSQGRIWIGTDGNGLFVYYPELKVVELLNKRLNLPYWLEYLEIRENELGEVYAALRNGGLMIFDKTLSSYMQYSKPNLPFGRLNSAIHFKGGEYWLSPGNIGFCRFDINEPKAPQQIVGLNGLVISKMLKDENNELWLTTESGLGHYKPVSRDFRMLTESEGLKNSYLLGFGFINVPNYGLVIGQENGFAVLPSNCNTEQVQPDKMSITDLKIFDKSVFYEKNILSANEIVLAHDQNMLTFRIGRLNYLDNRLLSFQYKMEGLDDSWNTPGQVPVITYSKLEPGHYKMLIRPTNAKGLVVGGETTLKIYIVPAWWQTLWFKFLAAFSFIALVIGLTSYYVRAKQKLEFAELEKIREVERVRTRIAQDIHDDVGAQLTRMSLTAEFAAMTKDKGAAHLVDKLKKIGQESRAAAANLREVVFAINPESDTFEDLQAYLQDASNRFLEGTGLQCGVYFPKPSKNLPVSPNIKRQVSMVLRETLNNTIKHAKASQVDIAFEMMEKNCYKLKVSDNGIGFDAKSLNGVSHGLKSMKKRAEEVQAEILITTQPNKGTTICLIGVLNPLMLNKS